MNIQLLHGDSHLITRDMVDNSIDLILTDPPYNLAQYSTGNMSFSWRATLQNDVAAWDTELFSPEAYAAHFLRILKPTGNLFIFTAYNQLGLWHSLLDPVFDTFQLFVWHKTNPAPKIRRAGFLNSCELIVCCWQKGHTWNFTKQSDMHNFFESGICQGKERLSFPAQKPVKLLKHLMQIGSREGDIVYDPFMGVGSTCAAALELGRNCIGVEKEQATYDMAVARLQKLQEHTHDTQRPTT